MTAPRLFMRRGTFYCATTGCRQEVKGIWCDEHRQKLGARPVYSEGETVEVTYRGIAREGIIESVGRKKVTVAIKVRGGEKTMLIKVPFDGARKVIA